MVELIQVFIGLAILCWVLYIFWKILLMFVEDCCLSTHNKILLRSLRKLLNDETCRDKAKWDSAYLRFEGVLDKIFLINYDKIGYEHKNLYHFTDIPFWIKILIKKDIKQCIRYVTENENLRTDIWVNIEKYFND